MVYVKFTLSFKCFRIPDVGQSQDLSSKVPKVSHGTWRNDGREGLYAARRTEQQQNQHP